MHHRPLLNRREAADLLRLRPQTLANLAVKGGGPPVIKLGKRCVYDRDKLLSWARSKEVASTAQAAG